MDTKNDPEVNAMQILLNTLQSLDDAGKDRVIQWVIQRLSLKDTDQTVTTHNKVVSNDVCNIVSDIKGFIASKKPSNEYQRLACLAYYLEKYEKKQSFTNKDLIDANSGAKLSQISNMSRSVNSTTNVYHFFASNGKDNKYLTTLG
ncbi:MAG: hypothetical protein LBE13_10830, partial [Bacteroidales bacterium]|nr:hypothetical protein [Bacteroidales bacterium]